MTIYEIKERTKETSPYFFSDKTMRVFGQTMSDFKVKKDGDRYKIWAKAKGFGGYLNMTTVRWFNPVNNELESE